jgi:hypothetical protein
LSDNASARELLERTLGCGGQALDPNARGGPSLASGQQLLRQAFVSAARCLCRDAAIHSFEAAARALDRRAESKGSARATPGQADSVATLGQSTVPDRAALARAEIQVARLVDEATGERRFVRTQKRTFWALTLIIVAAASVLVFASRRLHEPWEDFRWEASSAWGGYPLSDTLGGHDWVSDLIFHTDEEKDPWVVIDLLSTRTIHQVMVVNRVDCCRERGLPLVLDLWGEDGKFTEIAERASLFETWDVTFAPQRVRYVRLRSRGTTILHLSDIQIR